jgi:hypothetical protein
MTIRVQPGQEIANAAVRQRNARIGGTIVEIDGVPKGNILKMRLQLGVPKPERLSTHSPD